MEGHPQLDRSGRLRPGASNHPHQILIVEDEQSVARLLSRTLGEQGCLVDHATDGEEALARIRGDPEYDALLVDLVMPGMEGRIFYERLMENLSHLNTRVVFMTAQVLDDATRSFIEEAGRPLLRKPFYLSDLLEVLELR